MNQKQFSIIYIQSMAETGRWTEIEKFTTQRGVIKQKKLS
jgi:hypothetical protein